MKVVTARSVEHPSTASKDNGQASRMEEVLIIRDSMGCFAGLHKRKRT
jgi:hypothetical protein